MKRKILVVDDDATFRHVLVEILESEKFDVVSACNGVEGLEAFNKFHPNLLITDIRMPKMSGFQMAREILKIAPDIPIIFVSGWYDLERDGVQNGLGDSLLKPSFENIHFLKKPFRIHQLLSLIEKSNLKGGTRTKKTYSSGKQPREDAPKSPSNP